MTTTATSLRMPQPPRRTIRLFAPPGAAQSLSGEGPGDGLAQLRRLGRDVAREEPDHPSVLADQVLREVPRREMTRPPEVRVNRRLPRPGLRHDLREHREGDVVGE